MLDAPFPWFGGKRRVAGTVWRRFGDVHNYVEPFFGSGAVLFGRPHPARIETVNDKDGFVSNFWRAIKADPAAVAEYADWPVNENDLHARHIWLVGERDTLTARLEGDADFYDAKIAGWWVWGICCWIGRGWCSGEGPWHSIDGQRVNLRGGQGVNRQRVNLRGGGQGVNRQLVHLGGGQGVNRQREVLLDWFNDLSERLCAVRVCSGDWTRVCGPTPTFTHGITGVFLDPPYAQDERDPELYRIDDDVSAAVREWAIENGRNPLMRIALCGYEGEHEMPPEWECYVWKAPGGYGMMGEGAGRENALRERIWFSPACLKGPQQGVLL